MAGGSIGASTNNTYIVGQINWSASTNTEGNYSDVYAELRMWRNNTGYTTNGTWSGTIGIAGDNKWESKSITLTYNSNTLVIAHSARVYHNDDGTKQIYIGMDYNSGIPGTSYTTTSCGATVDLDTIPRASQPTISDLNNNVINTFDIGSPIRIHTNRASGSFTHTLRWGYGTLSGEIQQNVGLSWDWTPPMEMCTMTPASIQGYGAIYVDTYNGGTFIGTKGVGFYANVPSSVVPTITSVSTSEMTTSPNVATIVGKFVQGISSIRMYINGYTSYYGASIPSYKFNLNSRDWTNNGYIVDYGIADFTGTKTLTGYITDSRGRNSSTKTVNVEVLPYNVPNISTFTVQRCTDVGVLNEFGTYVKVVRVGTAASLMNVTEKNTIACKVFYKERSSPTWIEATACTVAASSSVATAVNNTAIVLSTFDVTKSYDFKMELTDKFNTTTSTATVSVGKVVMCWGQDGVGVGKIWQEGALDVGGLMVLNSASKAPLTADMKYYQNVVGWSYGGGTLTGVLKIRLPKLWTSTMINMKMMLYDHDSPYSKTMIEFGGFNDAGGSTWYNAQVNITGQSKIYRVRVGHDGVGACIFLGSTNSTWTHPKLVITDLMAGYQGIDGWETGWNITVLATETGLTIQSTVRIIYGGTLTGTVEYFAQEGIPPGYLYCDGATISRTAYGNLFSAIGTTFGAGDGSTTFSIPDLRGEFIRCYDNGAGRDPGRTFGSWQGSQNLNHVHLVYAYSGVDDNNFTGNNYRLQGSDAQVPYDQNTASSGGDEARPRNVALLACIKY